jgi:translation initiation factor 1
MAATTSMKFNTFGTYIYCVCAARGFTVLLAETYISIETYTYTCIISELYMVDAFEDAGDKGGVASEEKVHVRVQQRNGRKCVTTVAGLADDLDVKRICKAFKKNFSCNGAVQKDEEVGEVIQLSGDQRTNVKEFLVDQEICHSENVVLHGF